jgi:hypothetical protein
MFRQTRHRNQRCTGKDVFLQQWRSISCISPRASCCAGMLSGLRNCTIHVLGMPGWHLAGGSFVRVNWWLRIGGAWLFRFTVAE